MTDKHKQTTACKDKLWLYSINMSVNQCCCFCHQSLKTVLQQKAAAILVVINFALSVKAPEVVSHRIKPAPYQIKNWDQGLFSWESVWTGGDQTHLPEQIKHELAYSSGFLAISILQANRGRIFSWRWKVYDHMIRCPSWMQLMCVWTCLQKITSDGSG